MPKLAGTKYVCDRCGRSFQPEDTVYLVHLVVWREEDDPRKPQPRPSIAEILDGTAEPSSPIPGYDAAHPRFKFPKRRRAFNMSMHESCANSLTRLQGYDLDQWYREQLSAG
jgi:hypothetical protein